MTVPDALVTVADSVTVWTAELALVVTFAAVVTVAAGRMDSVCVLSLLGAKLPPPRLEAEIVYEPAAAPPGMENVAVAAPEATVPEVTGVPSVVPLCETVKVTVPALTVPPPLVTVADRVTLCAAVLNVAVEFVPVVVVAAALTRMVLEVPVMEVFNVSVAVIVSLPLVFSVALKVWDPLSDPGRNV